MHQNALNPLVLKVSIKKNPRKCIKTDFFHSDLCCHGGLIPLKRVLSKPHQNLCFQISEIITDGIQRKLRNNENLSNYA